MRHNSSVPWDITLQSHETQLFSTMRLNSSVLWDLTLLYFFGWNFIYFQQKEPVKVQILHHSSVPWDITLLYFFGWNFIYFQQKEPVKVQILWNFTWAVKSLKFCSLVGYFSKNHIKFHLKKYRRLISHDIEEWCKV